MAQEGEIMYPKEQQFADLLTKQKRKWVYHPKRFKVEDTHYHPDFYLPKEKLYIEIVGTRQAYHFNKKKIKEFKKSYPLINFVVLDYLSNIYPHPRIKMKKENKNMYCLNCKRKGAYLRLHTQEIVCHNCGYIGKIKKGVPMKTFSNITLRLTEAEGRLVEQLKVKNISQIQIFRTGLMFHQAENLLPLKVPTKVIKRTKEIR